MQLAAALRNVVNFKNLPPTAEKGAVTGGQSDQTPEQCIWAFLKILKNLIQDKLYDYLQQNTKESLNLFVQIMNSNVE